MSWILPLLIKHWRMAGITMLVAALILSAFVSQQRARERDRLAEELERSTRSYAAQIRLLEKTRIEREERDVFRTRQNRQFRAADNPPVELDGALRAAYDGLRERQRARAAR